MTILHVMHGFMGFGKTNFAKKLEKEIKAIRFDSEEWMRRLYGFDPEQMIDPDMNYHNVNALQFELMGKLLDLNVDIIFDTGSWGRKRRDEIRNFAKKHNAECKFYNIICDINLARERNLRRNESEKDTHLLITNDTFDMFLKKYEPMDKDEECVIINNNL